MVMPVGSTAMGVDHGVWRYPGCAFCRVDGERRWEDRVSAFTTEFDQAWIVDEALEVFDAVDLEGSLVGAHEADCDLPSYGS